MLVVLIKLIQNLFTTGSIHLIHFSCVRKWRPYIVFCIHCHQKFLFVSSILYSICGILIIQNNVIWIVLRMYFEFKLTGEAANIYRNKLIEYTICIYTRVNLHLHLHPQYYLERDVKWLVIRIQSNPKSWLVKIFSSSLLFELYNIHKLHIYLLKHACRHSPNMIM